MSLKEFSADSGAAIADVATSTEAFAMLEIGMVVEDVHNIRTTFDQAKLEELAETIRTVGVNQPILVRPLPAHRLQDTFEGRRKGAPLPSHEVVDGARRLRASKLAGKTTIPAMIKQLTDAQVLETQLVTALQRDGLSEMDEAEGYRRLVEEANLPKEQIGDKVGRSRGYVYARLKLLDLIGEGREALASGAIDSSRALRIARIPDGKLQKKALAEAQRKRYDGGPALSLREFETWLHDNVMLKLDQARFDIKDVTLHATAGACKACPKRTGADPDIFADVQGADICTDPKCFETKSNVHRDRLVAKAEAKGMTVIEGKAAKELMPSAYSTVIQGYSRLDQKRHDVDESGPTLRKLLGKDAPAPVLIENPYTKELIEAVPTAAAEEVLVTKGSLKVSSAKSQGNSVEAKIERIKANEEYEGPKAIRAQLFQSIKEAVRLQPDERVADMVTADLVRVWLVRQVENFDAAETFVNVLNLQVEKKHEQDYAAEERTAIAALQAASDANIFRALVLFLGSDEMTYYQHSRNSQNGTPAMSSIAKTTGLDIDALTAEATADRKTHLRSEIAMLKAKAEPKAPTAKKAATPKPARVKVAGGEKSVASPAAQSKRGKKSKVVAQAEIAAALRALDQAPDGASQEQAAEAAQTASQAPDGAKQEEAADAAPAAPASNAMWPFPTSRS